jgi:hypothetical protein
MEIAYDLASHGVETSVVIRSPVWSTTTLILKYVDFIFSCCLGYKSCTVYFIDSALNFTMWINSCMLWPRGWFTWGWN